MLAPAGCIIPRVHPRHAATKRAESLNSWKSQTLPPRIVKMWTNSDAKVRPVLAILPDPGFAHHRSPVLPNPSRRVAAGIFRLH